MLFFFVLLEDDIFYLRYTAPYSTDHSHPLFIFTLVGEYIKQFIVARNRKIVSVLNFFGFVSCKCNKLFDDVIASPLMPMRITFGNRLILL